VTGSREAPGEAPIKSFTFDTVFPPGRNYTNGQPKTIKRLVAACLYAIAAKKASVCDFSFLIIFAFLCIL
jgi:hypothetical protein